MKGVGMFLIVLLFVSCGYTEKELIGVYAVADYKNTFDTIQLMEHNKYRRKIYDKNKKLVLEMDGEWNVDGDIIEFKSPYYFNLDEDLVRFPELLQDTISGGLGYIWSSREPLFFSKRNTLSFCIGHFAVDLPDQNCYQKLKKPK